VWASMGRRRRMPVGAAAAAVPITISGGAVPATMMPNVTSATDNLKAATAAVPVTGGIFMAALHGLAAQQDRNDIRWQVASSRPRPATKVYLP